MSNDAYLRLPKVKHYTGLSTSTIWRLEREEQFPRRIRIGKRAVAWLKSDIKHWIENRAIKSLGEK
jgi:prophage regulatory protein